MSGDLARRFAALQALQRKQKIVDQAALAKASVPEPEKAGCLAVSEQEHDGVWYRVSDLVWERTLIIKPGEPGYPRLPKALWKYEATWPSEPRYAFDLETTGLSGGAGTVAFLSGIACFKADHIFVRQLFLEDYPGEPAFVERLVATLEGRVDAVDEPVILSWNGASFDLPLLRTRSIMNGIAVREWPHRDLLHPGRRLWRGLYDSCSLSELEGPLLGVERVDDCPGAEVPERWLSSLGSGQGTTSPQLVEVFGHHAQDLASLLGMGRIITAIEQAASEGTVPKWVCIHRPGARAGAMAANDQKGIAVSALGLARLVHAAEPETAIALISSSLSDTPIADATSEVDTSKLDTPDGARAAMVLALWLDAAHRRDEADRWWALVWKHTGLARAGLRTARGLYRRAGKPEEACVLLQALLARRELAPGMRADAGRLYERLQKNLVADK